MGQLIGGLVVLGVGFALLPNIKTMASTAISSANLTDNGAVGTLGALVPWFFIFALGFPVLFIILKAFNGDSEEPDEDSDEDEDSEDDSDEEEEEEEEEPKKITSKVIKAPIKKITSVIEEEIEPIIIKGKNRFEVKSKYE